MGDLKNAIERFKAALRGIRYPYMKEMQWETPPRNAAPPEDGVQVPVMPDLLKVLHFVLVDYSRHVAEFVLNKGYHLAGKTDARFVDHAFRLLRNEFQYFPALTATQFLSPHYVERKLQLVADVIKAVMKMHVQHAKSQKRQEAVWTKPKETKVSDILVENHLVPESPTIVMNDPAVVAAMTATTAGTPQQQLSIQARQPSPARRIVEHLHAESKCQIRKRLDPPTAKQSPAPVAPIKHVRKVARPATTSVMSSQAQLPLAPTSLQEAGMTSPPLIQRGLNTRSLSNSRAPTIDIGEVVADLSKQLGDLTTLLLGRINSIDDRLVQVETQVQQLSLQASSTCRNELTTPPSQSSSSSSLPTPCTPSQWPELSPHATFSNLASSSSAPSPMTPMTPPPAPTIVPASNPSPMQATTSISWPPDPDQLFDGDH